MRLLRCSLTVDDENWIPTIEEFSTDIPPYAILSHRWGKPNDEVSFNDLDRGLDVSHKPGYRKLRRCCELAFQAGLKFAWIDTCCIDKRSSAELSEAINSTFKWYSNSALCYAYLDDVITEETPANHAMEKSSFRASKWWTRGWTLQELIAPGSVLFFDQNWKPIETRNRLAWLVREITSIEIEVLREDYNWLGHRTSVAQKMSWAARRQTTRQEDRAYSLMGLFGVNMPLLYGEGRRAFIRLQEEIMRTTADQSLFAWRGGGAYMDSVKRQPRGNRDIILHRCKYAKLANSSASCHRRS
ncbi:HET-domain-containing protein [Acephala macrosclerotiorum]|nr:HET-domain-containing protein [Acephala macrosclerotiorum]